MRLELRKYTAGEIDVSLIYGGLAFIAVIFSLFVPLLDLFPPCSFKAYFHIPCPTCGSTRSLIHFAKGEFTAAFVMNPFIATVFFILIPVFFYRLITRMMRADAIEIVLSAGEQRISVLLVVVLFLLNWIYLIIYL